MKASSSDDPGPLKNLTDHELTRGKLVSTLRHTTMTNISAWEPQFQQTLKAKGWRYGRIAFAEAKAEERWLK